MSQSWGFIGTTDAKTETSIFWPPHAKSWFIGKDPDAGRHWGQEEKGTTEDKMAEWHHWLDGHEFEWTPGVGDGREAGRAVIYGVAKSWTRLSNWLNCTESLYLKVCSWAERHTFSPSTSLNFTFILYNRGSFPSIFLHCAPNFCNQL